jgi:hypothetical protein
MWEAVSVIGRISGVSRRSRGFRRFGRVSGRWSRRADYVVTGEMEHLGVPPGQGGAGVRGVTGGPVDVRSGGCGWWGRGHGGPVGG